MPDYVKLLDDSVKGLKVGIVKEHVYPDYVDKEVRNAVLTAADVIRDQGASVKEVSLPGITNDRRIASQIIYVEGSAIHHRHVREHIGQYDHNMRITLLNGSLIPAQTYYEAQCLRAALRQEFLELMTTIDLLIFPTSADVAPPIVDKPGLGKKEEFRRAMISQHLTLTNLANLAGAPELSVPCGFKDGLPLGLQITGRLMGDETVLRLGHVYQQTTD